MSTTSSDFSSTPSEKCGIAQPHDVDDETDSKEREIQRCLHGSNDDDDLLPTLGKSLPVEPILPSVDLIHLRQLAISRGGLQTMALRRQAWPKLVAAHEVLWEGARAATAAAAAAAAADVPVVDPVQYHPPFDSVAARNTRRTIQRLAQTTKWSKHQMTQSPKTFNELLRLVLAETCADAGSDNDEAPCCVTTPTPCTTVSANRLRRVSFDLPLDDDDDENNDDENDLHRKRRQDRARLGELRRYEQQIIRKLMEHLHRCDPTFPFQDGIQNLIAVLWIVLETPSLTSITSLQLAQYPWRVNQLQRRHSHENPNDAHNEDNDDLFPQLLLLWDPILFHHFRSLGMESTPYCIAYSWIPHWLSADLKDLGILLRVWDFLMALSSSSPSTGGPATMVYLAVALVVHFRDPLLGTHHRPVLDSILQHLPSDGLEKYDEQVVERVLEECMQGMQDYPISSILLVPSTGDIPDWVQATTAPTDYQVLQRLQQWRNRQDDDKDSKEMIPSGPTTLRTLVSTEQHDDELSTLNTPCSTPESMTGGMSSASPKQSSHSSLGKLSPSVSSYRVCYRMVIWLVILFAFAVMGMGRYYTFGGLLYSGSAQRNEEFLPATERLESEILQETTPSSRSRSQIQINSNPFIDEAVSQKHDDYSNAGTAGSIMHTSLYRSPIETNVDFLFVEDNDDETSPSGPPQYPQGEQIMRQMAINNITTPTLENDQRCNVDICRDAEVVYQILDQPSFGQDAASTANPPVKELELNSMSDATSTTATTLGRCLAPRGDSLGKNEDDETSYKVDNNSPTEPSMCPFLNDSGAFMASGASPPLDESEMDSMIDAAATALDHHNDDRETEPDREEKGSNKVSSERNRLVGKAVTGALLRRRDKAHATEPQKAQSAESQFGSMVRGIHKISKRSVHSIRQIVRQSPEYFTVTADEARLGMNHTLNAIASGIRTTNHQTGSAIVAASGVLTKKAKTICQQSKIVSRSVVPGFRALSRGAKKAVDSAVGRGMSFIQRISKQSMHAIRRGTQQCQANFVATTALARLGTNLTLNIMGTGIRATNHKAESAVVAASGVLAAEAIAIVQASKRFSRTLAKLLLELGHGAKKGMGSAIGTGMSVTSHVSDRSTHAIRFGARNGKRSLATTTELARLGTNRTLNAFGTGIRLSNNKAESAIVAASGVLAAKAMAIIQGSKRSSRTVAGRLHTLGRFANEGTDSVIGTVMGVANQFSDRSTHAIRLGGQKGLTYLVTFSELARIGTNLTLNAIGNGIRAMKHKEAAIASRLLSLKAPTMGPRNKRFSRVLADGWRALGLFAQKETESAIGTGMRFANQVCFRSTHAIRLGGRQGLTYLTATTKLVRLGTNRTLNIIGTGIRVTNHKARSAIVAASGLLYTKAVTVGRAMNGDVRSVDDRLYTLGCGAKKQAMSVVGRVMCETNQDNNGSSHVIRLGDQHLLYHSKRMRGAADLARGILIFEPSRAN